MSLTPHELETYLSALVRGQLKIATMIWGPPGVGKSSVVAQVARQHDLDFVDVRLSQLAPTDLRGLPVPEADGKGSGVSKWYHTPHGRKIVLDGLDLTLPPACGNPRGATVETAFLLGPGTVTPARLRREAGR